MKTQRLNKTSTRGTTSASRQIVRYSFGLTRNERQMKKVRERPDSDEPIGIVISRGDRTEQRPIFSAYIWGPAPEPVIEASKVA